MGEMRRRTPGRSYSLDTGAPAGPLGLVVAWTVGPPAKEHQGAVGGSAPVTIPNNKTGQCSSNELPIGKTRKLGRSISYSTLGQLKYNN